MFFREKRKEEEKATSLFRNRGGLLNKFKDPKMKQFWQTHNQGFDEEAQSEEEDDSPAPAQTAG